ncbi:MAG: CoA-binding protein [Fibrobacterales bacterium]
MNVAVLGASAKADRYSYKALKMLQEHGHTVFPVNPAQTEIDGVQCYPDLTSIPETIHTITMYVSPRHSGGYAQQIIERNPDRVIFNPGSENYDLIEELTREKIECIKACTLVMLSTDQF